MGSVIPAANSSRKPDWPKFPTPGYVSNARRPKRRKKLDEDKKHRLIFLLAIFLFFLALDQITKIWAVAKLSQTNVISVLGDFLRFRLVYNTGGALGTELGSSTFYLISSCLILAFIVYFIITYINIKGLVYPMAIIASGAVGNIIDRIRIGRVIDFIDADFFDINIFGFNIERWWIFNIADAAITVGIVFLLFFVIFCPEKTKEKKPIPETEPHRPDIAGS